MSLMQTELQAKVFDFALTELVRQHKNSFQPLWTVDSWAKFLIWVALNCGLSGERESLEVFADALGTPLTVRMRKLFFERTLDDFSLKLMADPAEMEVLVMPLYPGGVLTFEIVHQALDKVGLIEQVVADKSQWKSFDALVAVPWQSLGI